MLTLIWVILLFADKGSGTTPCPKSSSITLSNVSAQAGLCVVLACSFTTDNGEAESITWYKNNGNLTKTIFNSSNNTNADSEFQGRVSLLEPGLKNKNCSIIINDLTKSDSGSYRVVITVNTINCTLISNANVTVTELSEKPTLEIPPITVGQQTTLTCTAPGLCSGSTPKITWIWHGSGQIRPEVIENKTEFKSENLTAFSQRHISALTFNASAKYDGGRITCKVTFKSARTNEPVTTNETKTLHFKVKYALTSSCVIQSKVLTCVCTSDGFPLATIKWPHLKNHTEYSVTTTVSNSSVNSTITVSQDHCHNTTVECVISNSTDRANLSITIMELKDDSMLTKILMIIKDYKVIIAALTGFVIGTIFSTVIACLIAKSRRKKWKRSENQSENLEMVSTEAVPVMDADQAATYDAIREPEEAEGEPEPVAQLPSNGDVVPKEVEYSNINFSAIRAKNPEEAVKMQDATDTEYAEIKREEPRQANAQEGSEMSEGNEQELMSEEDNEVKQADDEGGEDVALYSSVEELMG